MVIMKQRFQLFNTQYGETIHVVEMDVDLIQPEAGIVNPDTLTLSPLKNGGVWTLIPIETNQIAALRRLHKVYMAITTEPIVLPSSMVSRIDSLFEAVSVLFNDVEYVVIESKVDMQNLINPPNDHKPKMVKHNILGDMLDEIVASDQLP
tara:strand:+ start:534 stop:983 length:450 start_codon:yes stop_codon:yes gene_type:complete